VGRRGRRGRPRAIIIGLVGSILVAAGCFAPVAAKAGGGYATLLAGDSIAARLILVAALASLVLIFAGRRKALLLTGVFAGLLVMLEFIARQAQLAPLPETGSPGAALLSSFSYEFGWGLLVIGVAFLIGAGLAPARRRASGLRPIRNSDRDSRR
jgi:hypothetical protein